MAPARAFNPVSSESRIRLLSLLSERPDRTIADLSDATGLHANTVREHLNRLIDLGFVLQTTELRTVRGRPRSLYRVADGTPTSSSPITQRKVREAAERGDLMRAVMPETITATLTVQEQHQLDALAEHLDESGFTHVLDELTLTVELRACAMVTAMTASPSRCAVHLALLQSVLTQAGGPLAVEGIHPGPTPRDCVVKLVRRAD